MRETKRINERINEQTPVSHAPETRRKGRKKDAPFILSQAFSHSQ